MNFRTTIVFAGAVGARIVIDGSRIVGLHGAQRLAIEGFSIAPDLLKVGDTTFRKAEVEEYLARLTGLQVTIETEVA